MTPFGDIDSLHKFFDNSSDIMGQVWCHKGRSANSEPFKYGFRFVHLNFAGGDTWPDLLQSENYFLRVIYSTIFSMNCWRTSSLPSQRNYTRRNVATKAFEAAEVSERIYRYRVAQSWEFNSIPRSIILAKYRARLGHPKKSLKLPRSIGHYVNPFRKPCVA